MLAPSLWNGWPKFVPRTAGWKKKKNFIAEWQIGTTVGSLSFKVDGSLQDFKIANTRRDAGMIRSKKSNLFVHQIGSKEQGSKKKRRLWVGGWIMTCGQRGSYLFQKMWNFLLVLWFKKTVTDPEKLVCVCSDRNYRSITTPCQYKSMHDRVQRKTADDKWGETEKREQCLLSLDQPCPWHPWLVGDSARYFNFIFSSLDRSHAAIATRGNRRRFASTGKSGLRSCCVSLYPSHSDN